MEYYIFLLLFIPILNAKCTYGIYNTYLPCIAHINYQKKYQEILSNIKNNYPGLNGPIIRELFEEHYFCLYREFTNQLTKDTDRAPVYKFMFRYILRDEEKLLLIHKAFCNSGQSTGIKECLEILGDDYKCSQLVNTFGLCHNDANDQCD